jgi:hypothetical protein
MDYCLIKNDYAHQTLIGPPLNRLIGLIILKQSKTIRKINKLMIWLQENQTNNQQLIMI